MKKLMLIIFCFGTLLSSAKASLSFDFDQYDYIDSNWAPDNIDIVSKTPYGGFIFSEFLDSQFETQYINEPIREFMNYARFWEGNNVYLIYAYDMHVTQWDISELIQFVEYGNDAIIICEYPATEILGKFMWRDYKDTIANSLDVWINAEGGSSKKYPLAYLKRQDTISYAFRVLSDQFFYKDVRKDVQPLISANGASLGYSIPKGAGEFHFISAPMLFSNIHIKQPKVQRMVENLFSRFRNKTFYIDQYSDHRPEAFVIEEDFNSPEDGPLGYVFSNTALSWSYTILLVAGMLFLLFTTKRKQRIIPLMKSDENTSMEFVKTVSHLYLSKKRHSKLVAQKKKVFMHFVRQRYFIVGNEATDEYKTQLLLKSGVDRALIDRIFDGFNQAMIHVTTAEALITLHNDIEEFHKSCK